MILYKYTADCSRTVYRDTDKSNDQLEIFFSARGLIPGINANLYTEYCVRKKFRIMITNVVRDQMTIVAAITHEVAVDACEELIRETLPQTEILKREEITTEEQREARRAAYYNYYTGKKWGSAESYDLCVDSSILGLQATEKYIAEFIRKRYGL